MAGHQNTEARRRAVRENVISAFLICDTEELLGPLRSFLKDNNHASPLVYEAVDGLQSVVLAASLPFQLTNDAVCQSMFDRKHIAARIRADDCEGADVKALAFAKTEMANFLASSEGVHFMRDEIVHELDDRLSRANISAAAGELLVQTVVSTWGVFENFARSFIIDFINANPKMAQPILKSPDLKEYFGRPAIDIQVIGEHGFDLTGIMGNVIFHGKKLDSLSVIKKIMSALFKDKTVTVALGGDLWSLNQRRHLLVHKRGLVDEEYISQTGDKLVKGDRLTITSADVEKSVIAVQLAIITLSRIALNMIKNP